MKPRQAFSLIELLVVISIISLLIAILLPALSKARDSANAMLCLSNVRQLHVATSAFGAEHDNKGFTHTPWDSVSYFHLIEDYTQDVDEIRHCPTTTHLGFKGNDVNPNPDYPYDPNGTSTVTGSARGWWRASVWNHPTSRSHKIGEIGGYGFNATFYSGPFAGMNRRVVRQEYAPLYGLPSVSSADYNGTYENQVMSTVVWNDLQPPDADKVPMFADSNSMVVWFTNPNPSSINRSTLALGGKGSTSYSFVLDRHDDATNIVFADGHGSLEPVNLIFDWQWHKKYQPKGWLPIQ